MFRLILTALPGLHRLALAPNSEWGPAGRNSSSLSSGRSGMALIVTLLTPALSIVVELDNSSITPSPCKTTTGLGRMLRPCETRYTGPASSWVSTGVRALAIPMTDAYGHDAGSPLKVAGGQAL